MASGFRCWQCGGSLKAVPRPIRRLSRCPHCRADLHVCRLCNHYAPRLLGECDHDHAERVLDKTVANFCTRYRPRAGAHAPPKGAAAEQAAAALGALFGADDASVNPASAPTPDAARRAREELASLFGMEEARADGSDDGTLDSDGGQPSS